MVDNTDRVPSGSGDVSGERVPKELTAAEHTMLALRALPNGRVVDEGWIARFVRALE